MKGYKGFAPGLKCLGKQYAENTVFEEEEAKVCECGMHFCARPLDVLGYYPPCDDNGVLNDFCDVEALDEAFTGDDGIYCTRKLKVGAKIGIVGLVMAEVEYITEKIGKIPGELKTVNSGNRSAAVNSGNRSAAVNSGDGGVAIALGIESKAKAALGGWIVLAEWACIDFQRHRIGLRSAKVDGVKIKADTYYRLINGEFVAEEEST